MEGRYARLVTEPVSRLDDGEGDLGHRIGTVETWDAWLAVERDRFERYGRPCTVVAIEVVGVDVLSRWFGDEIAREAVDALLSAAVRRTRDSDLVALTAWGYIAVILPETDEVSAIHVINRIEATYDAWNERWLVSQSTRLGTAAARLAMGWASAGPDRSFDEAVLAAAQRRDEAKRRAESVAAGVGGPAGIGAAPRD